MDLIYNLNSHLLLGRGNAGGRWFGHEEILSKH